MVSALSLLLWCCNCFAFLQVFIVKTILSQFYTFNSLYSGISLLEHFTSASVFWHALYFNLCFYAGRRTFADHLGSLVISRIFTCRRIIILGEHYSTCELPGRVGLSWADKNLFVKFKIFKLKWSFTVSFFPYFMQLMACLVTIFIIYYFLKRKEK